MTSTSLATAELQDFFDRIAAGDYHGLAKELGISHRPLRHSTKILEALHSDDPEEEQDADTSIQSIDSVESFKFQPTAEGLHRAVSLLRGDEKERVPPTPEEDEAFQFTFRLMIHKLYSIKDFARMVEEVVSNSQARFRPLSPEFTTRRRSSLSFSFNAHGADGDSFVSTASTRTPTSPSYGTSLPSSPSQSSSWMGDHLPSPQFEKTEDADARAVKKRLVGRKLTVVDSSMDEENGGDPTWVYDATIASVESPPSIFDQPFFPAAGSPARAGYSGLADEGDYTSRKRRYSFLAARGF